MARAARKKDDERVLLNTAPQNLPWFSAQWQELCTQHQTNRLPHALLLTGQAGIGKVEFARAFAHHLLCASQPTEGIRCGTCKPCGLLNAGSHPDLMDVFPAEPGKKILIDAVRELCQELTLTAHSGGARVAVIQPADRMTTQAANSLLKTLEEPVSGVFIILVSAYPAQLPATIRSRCQKFALPSPSQGESVDWVHSQNNTVAADLLVALSNGAPIAAVGMAENPVLDARDTLVQDLANIVDGQEDPLAVADRWTKLGWPDISRWLPGCLSDLIRLKSVSEPPMLTNTDLCKPLGALANKLEIARLYQQLDDILLISNGQRTHMNQAMQVQEILINWSHRG